MRLLERVLPFAFFCLLAIGLLWPALPGGGEVMAADDFLLFLPPFDGLKPADLTQPSNFILSDSIFVFHPDQLWARELMRGGELPIWNPLQGAGQPILAQQQTAPLYPGTLITFLLPYWESLGLVAGIKLVLGALGTYFVGRSFGLGRTAATFAGVVFAFGTYMVTWLAHPHTNAYILLPWLLLLTRRVVTRGRPGDVLGLGAVGGLALLGGHPQSAVLAFIPSVAYAAWLLVDRPEGEPPSRGRTLALLAGAGALSLLIGAIMLLPFLEVLTQAYNSDRGNAAIERNTIYSFFFPELWGRPDKVLLPVPLANYQERTAYIGVCPLLLALAGLVARRPARVQIFLGVLGIASLTAVIDTPLWSDLVRKIPGLASMSLVRALIIVAFCGALLAGFGIQRLIEGDRRERMRLVAGFAAFALAAPAVYFLQQGVPWGDLGHALRELPQLRLGPPPPEVIQASAVVRWLVFAGAATLVLAVPLFAPRAAVGVAVAVVILTGVELVGLNRGYQPAVEKRLVEPLPESVRYVQEHQASGRVLANDEAFGPELASRYGVRDSRTHALPVLERYSRLWLTLGGVGFQRTKVGPDYTAAPVLNDIMGVEHVLSGAPSADDELLFEGEGGVILANTGAFPRAYVAYGWRDVADQVGAAVTVKLLEGDPDALRDEPAVEDIGSSRPAPEPATPAGITTDEPTEVVVELDAERDGLLLLHDNWYPGWKAYVDGEEREIHPANVTFRAVEVPAGSHTVRFAYEPLTVKAGAVLSGIGVLIVLGGYVALFIRRRRRPA